MQFLKAKVDAGADFIITQLFFEAATFDAFVRDCRNAGITVPIIPGIFPIQGYASLRQLVRLSRLVVPQSMRDAIEPIKDDDEAIRSLGVRLCVGMCRELFAGGYAPGLHFYTLNREVAVREILTELDLWSTATPRKPLPWRRSANDVRFREDVRPIFWNSRPQSYLQRTASWDDFPNGRWGDSSSPAFGELTDYYLFHLHNPGTREMKRRMWGAELRSVQDVFTVFVRFIAGDDISCLPWNPDPLSQESDCLVQKLMLLNMHGILTINSQPAVNGLPSEHPVHGWGRPGGYVYQKAYLEFFVSQDMLPILARALKEFTTMTYHIMNADESVNLFNGHGNTPVAVTWGVFPGQEILQPTIVDPISFKYWKDEAFGLWRSQWGALYEAGSESRAIIDTIHDTYLLCNIVDNDFVHPKMDAFFDRILVMRQCPASAAESASRAIHTGPGDPNGVGLLDLSRKRSNGLNGRARASGAAGGSGGGGGGGDD